MLWNEAVLADSCHYHSLLFHFSWFVVNWTQPIPAVTTDNVASNVLSPFDSHTPLDSPDACRWTRNMLFGLRMGIQKKKKKKGFYIRLTNV